MGLSEDAKRSVVVYFIMGRSENSRNRIFARTSDGIRTEARDPDKLTDPSLVIYNPVRAINGAAVVTNGSQTDAIIENLSRGSDFKSALSTWEFEPDPPIYTPRISGIMNADASYCMSIIKAADGDPSCCCRCFFDYSASVPGQGRFISTYKRDGSPPPSFAGEPIAVNIRLKNGLGYFAENIWDAMDDSNKVSLYARQTALDTGKIDELIINKYA